MRRSLVLVVAVVAGVLSAGCGNGSSGNGQAVGLGNFTELQLCKGGIAMMNSQPAGI